MPIDPPSFGVCGCCGPLTVLVDVLFYTAGIQSCADHEPDTSGGPGDGVCPGMWFTHSTTTAKICGGGDNLNTTTTVWSVSPAFIPYPAGDSDFCTPTQTITSVNTPTTPCDAAPSSSITYDSEQSMADILNEATSGATPSESLYYLVSGTTFADFRVWQDGTNVGQYTQALAQTGADHSVDCADNPVVVNSKATLNFTRIGRKIPLRIYWVETTTDNISGAQSKIMQHLDITADTDTATVDIEPTGRGVTLTPGFWVVYCPYLNQDPPDLLSMMPPVSHDMAATPPIKLPQEQLAEHGRTLWTALHTMAWHYPSEPTAEDVRTTRKWLAEFAQSIPNYGCKCKDAWDKLNKALPPPIESGRGALYWWTVAIHDAINKKLGKPLHAPDYTQHHPALQVAL